MCICDYNPMHMIYSIYIYIYIYIVALNKQN